jgi:hypothetical protein
LADETVELLLISKHLVSDPTEARRLASYSAGSITEAVALADAELWRSRDEMLAQLAREPIETVKLSQAIISFVDAAGKEAPPRRARARRLIGFAVDFYRQLLHRQASLATQASASGEVGLLADANLRSAAGYVSAAISAGQTDPEATASRIERSLEALSHIDRNANQTTLIEAWIDDLRLARNGVPVEV